MGVTIGSCGCMSFISISFTRPTMGHGCRKSGISERKNEYHLICSNNSPVSGLSREQEKFDLTLKFTLQSFHKNVKHRSCYLSNKRTHWFQISGWIFINSMNYDSV